ncbi:hypothetical protein LM602_00985 [Candidatus Acetothermia bacterium]|nr:hypothetical protein [Candidatus Acetothermia bacterium]MCI2431120.1 hypothetical protein [Candidatus Acetothermia bacterium]
MSRFEGKVVLVTGANHDASAGMAKIPGREQARWLTGQLIYVGGGHVMPL